MSSLPPPGRRDRALQVGVAGSGSNLPVPDEDVRRRVVKLDDELTAIEFDGARIGGAGVSVLAASPALLASGRVRR